jgi:hypothetical protein
MDEAFGMQLEVHGGGVGNLFGTRHAHGVTFFLAYRHLLSPQV